MPCWQVNARLVDGNHHLVGPGAVGLVVHAYPVAAPRAKEGGGGADAAAGTGDDEHPAH